MVCKAPATTVWELSFGKARRRGECSPLSAPPLCQAAETSSPETMLKGLRSSASGLRDLWIRLNGGGRRAAGGPLLPESLPLPATTPDAGRQEASAQLNLSIDALEKKLQVGCSKCVILELIGFIDDAEPVRCPGEEAVGVVW